MQYASVFAPVSGVPFFVCSQELVTPKRMPPVTRSAPVAPAAARGGAGDAGMVAEVEYGFERSLDDPCFYKFIQGEHSLSDGLAILR